MAGTWRMGTASMVLATIWTTAGRVGEAQLAPLPRTVAVYDYAVLPPPVLERAKEVATTIYGRIGVSLTWLAGWPVAAGGPANPAACPDSAAPLIHLRLLGRSANPRRATGDLGFAGSGGTLASVLASASHTWRRARASMSASCWAPSSGTRLATCSSRPILTPQE